MPTLDEDRPERKESRVELFQRLTDTYDAQIADLASRIRVLEDDKKEAAGAAKYGAAWRANVLFVFALVSGTTVAVGAAFGLWKVAAAFAATVPSGAH